MVEKYSNFNSLNIDENSLKEFEKYKVSPSNDEEIITTIFDGISEQLSEHFVSNLHGGFECVINWKRIPVDLVEIVRIGSTLNTFQNNFNNMLNKYRMVISAKDQEFKVDKVTFINKNDKIWIKAEKISDVAVE